jgi:hypothetical protein
MSALRIAGSLAASRMRQELTDEVVARTTHIPGFEIEVHAEAVDL